MFSRLSFILYQKCGNKINYTNPKVSKRMKRTGRYSKVPFLMGLSQLGDEEAPKIDF
jgi:hypothetical protein